MKILGDPPVRGMSFEELMGRLAEYSRAARQRLLKTAHGSGLLTDGDLITRLTADERRFVAKDHAAMLSSSKSYAEVDPLDLRNALPRRLGAEIVTAEYAGQGKEYQLVLLKGKGTEQLIEARAFATLVRRHPDASWYFARGVQADRKPVVLLESFGFSAGRLLGAAAPVCVKGVIDVLPVKATASWRKLSDDPREFRYLEVN